MDQQPSKHPYLRAVSATFKELPGWQKLIVALTCIFISPAILLVATLVSLSLFPLALLGPWEGNAGPRTLARDVQHGVEHQHDRTRKYYAG